MAIVEILLMTCIGLLGAWQIRYSIYLKKTGKSKSFKYPCYVFITICMLIAVGVIGEITVRGSSTEFTKYVSIVTMLLGFYSSWYYFGRTMGKTHNKKVKMTPGGAFYLEHGKLDIQSI